MIKRWNRLALCVALAVGYLVAASVTTFAAPPPTVMLYGKGGTFGTLESARHVSTGQSIRTQAVTGWEMTPGQSVFYGVAAGGELFFGGFTQNGNALNPSANHMALSVFKPHASSFRNLVIPTSNGSISAVNPYFPDVGGADVADTQAVTVNGLRKLAFISTAPYHRWDEQKYGLYPSLGFLQRDGSGNWSYDAASSKTAQQLQDLNGAAGRDAFPTEDDPYALTQTATNKGMVELALLPKSGNLVINRYFGESNGGFVVLDAGGHLKAKYELPDIPDSAGGSWYASPKFVETDPTSALGDERFFIQYDAYYTGPDGTKTAHHPVQEFSFNANEPDYTRAIRPVSAALATDNEGNNFGYANYDSKGNLWIGSNVPGNAWNGGDMTVFRRDPETGKRSYETGRCAAPADFPASGWRISCPPEIRVAGRASDGWLQAIMEDTKPGTAKTGTIYGVTVKGRVIPVRPAYRSGLLTGGNPQKIIDLDVYALRDTQPGYTVNARKAYIDPASRWLWMPVSTDNATTNQVLNKVQPQWAYRVDLDRAY